MEGDPLDRRKLCGFLRAVLAVAEPRDPDPPPQTPARGAPCDLFGEGPNVGFRSECGISLVPIRDGDGGAGPGEARSSAPGDGGASASAAASRKRRRRGVVVVNGSTSVVHHLHALVAHGCVEIEARVLSVSARGEGESRAVVLVDVFLPIAAWSGWQFPWSPAVAASVFKHLSCMWELRNSLLNFEWDSPDHTHDDDKSIWNCCDCHVLGCEMHRRTPLSINKKLFDLHEIFKSLPSVDLEKKIHYIRVKPKDTSRTNGIWNLPDEVLTSVLTHLGPRDLVRVSMTCRYLRFLAASVMPCMKLKLFPHQEAAVEWMLKRERNPDVLAHPLYKDFCTEDGFSFYMNTTSGKIHTEKAPTINDFRGGMFCDEPGLGKTITALSLILKTQETLADPPQGVDVTWCMHRPNQRCGYYEVGADNLIRGNIMSTWKRFLGKSVRRGEVSSPQLPLGISSVENSRSSSQKGGRSMNHDRPLESAASSCGKPTISFCAETHSMPRTRVLRCSKSLSCVRRNLMDTFAQVSGCGDIRKKRDNVVSDTSLLDLAESWHPSKLCTALCNQHKKLRRDSSFVSDSSETWVQCDSCRKWRKLTGRSTLDATAVWFCSMNTDPFYQNCAAPEESWDVKETITYLPGFSTKGTQQGKEENVSFFTSVLKEHFTSFNSETKKALNWLANLPQKKLLEMETVGVRRSLESFLSEETYGYHKIFEAFGLVRRVERRITRWCYPSKLHDLEFDTVALRIALTKPLDLVRLYLSKATLIVVPANLVDHWKMQIERHIQPGQLRVYIWASADQEKPCAHSLAWDYDIVITTFNRLSAEWGPRKRSVLMQIHWLRVMLDEGHTLGSSLSLTNKLQMAVSLAASSRWILTGTPTPNTPNSHVSHLQPMLKFLHEEAYGQNQEYWEAGIQRPFEVQTEEGRSRLIQLLQRTMISARKSDLNNIPPCIKRVTFLDFNEEHAKSYNELVLTVRRNILMADWNDPSHVESLLNPKQWKFRSRTVRNIRLSCCVAGHIKVVDAGQDIQETMDILVQHGLDPLSEEYAFIRISLLDGCNCFRCKYWCRLPIITPCRHLLCLGCVALDSEKCTYPGCGHHYEMQSPEILTRPENPNPKWPVPKDLIELQPSYKQDDWDPDWQSTSSSKVAYLVEKLKMVQESNRKFGYSASIDTNSNVPISVSNDRETGSETDGMSSRTLPEKVIIFSQFLEHINIIEQQLTIAGIKFAAMYSPLHSFKKIKSLMSFQQDPNCLALVMDGSAALGLDLSFVTHVFLMEPIWDRSMEEQVISRAHRMGATRTIHVETLAMRGTIEEQMLEFLQDPNACGRVLLQENSNSDLGGARTHRTLHDFAENNYLAKLGFIDTGVKT
ncbi:F-box protein At3g54460 isoform X1 [Ananas comosus]|uniref:F-box protein At3g54460 isoform X1 n=2 Tax=Ananas comosus TaxID=4615 RepID=A0A6P5F1C2_ANACO|nr:F-box protein At3g54460 isoform X1 [Ananas comosus]XP_020087289.1 F-box protein At3g54460 isoform X1 [Ananas comosus]